jgi:hypothetical protein
VPLIIDAVEMFTRDRLLDRCTRLLRDIVPVEVSTFGPLEQPEVGTVVVHRIAASDVKDAVQFWVSSAIAKHGRKYAGRRWFEDDLCRPLTRAQFNELVFSHSHGIFRPGQLPLHPAKHFVGAMQMADEWNEVSALAAWTDEYVAFYWETDA